MAGSSEKYVCKKLLNFSSVLMPFYILISNIWEFWLLYISNTWCYHSDFSYSILLAKQWYFIEVLICISLT